MGSPEPHEGGGEVFHAETADGWRLELERLRRPAGAPPARAACLLGHAMMANRRSLDRPAGLGLASTLARGALEVYLFDARGHGGSGPRPRDGGAGLDWTYDDVCLRDIPAAVAAVRARHPDLPLAVVGHSLVGHGCLAWLGVRAASAQAPGAPGAPPPVDAVVGFAAGVWVPALEPDPTVWAVKRGVVETWNALAATSAYFPARALGLGSEDVSRRYIAQFVAWVRGGRWTSREGHDYLAALAHVRCPVLLVAGNADRLMCRPPAARAFADRLTAAATTFRLVRPGEFPGLVPDHMGLVTRRAALPLWVEVRDWIERSLCPAPAARP